MKFYGCATLVVVACGLLGTAQGGWKDWANSITDNIKAFGKDLQGKAEGFMDDVRKGRRCIRFALLALSLAISLLQGPAGSMTTCMHLSLMSWRPL